MQRPAEQIARLLPAVRVSDIQQLALGWETDVYGFTAEGPGFQPARNLVLRIYNGEMAGGREGAEASALRQLRAQGYPVPELVAVASGPNEFGGPYLIMERVAGQMMWRHFEAACYGEEMMGLYTDLLYRLHQLQGIDGATANTTFDLAFLEQWVKGTDLEPGFQPLLTKLAEWEPKVGRRRTTPIHGDFHEENVLITPEGKPYVIDWSCFALDDPRMDVAQSVVLAITNGRPQVGAEIRRRYESLAGAPLIHFDFFELLALTRRVLTMMTVLVHGSAAIGLRPGLESELRKSAPRIRQLVGYLGEQSGLDLSALVALVPVG